MTAFVVTLGGGADREGFRAGVRRGIGARVKPEHIQWQAGEAASLFGAQLTGDPAPITLPREAAELIDCVVCHRDPEKYDLLYTMVWRIVEGERTLLEIHSDPLVHRLNLMAKSVRRDIHKMHAFVRFRRIEDEGGERFVAWFEPEHYIVERVADFFVKRYPSMRWSILTPHGSLHWDLKELRKGPPGDRREAPATGDIEAAWDCYFQSTFNPARVNVAQMQKEMPRKYWRNMPETKLIPDMLRMASSRVEEMIATQPRPAIKRNPDKALTKMLDGEIKSLAQLNGIIAASEPFVKGGTRAVLGEGPIGAEIAFIGEQPGDQEDLQGRPFVGPAGQLLDRALKEAGIDRRKCYLTNAVKHFKYEQRGKHRLHQNPTAGEVKHYRWWLMKELDFVAPQLVVALGGSAARALTGKTVAVTRSRGSIDFDGRAGFLTVHPSYILRIPSKEDQAEAYQDFIRDLRVARGASEKRAAA